jgi:DNA-binding transcriptional LysR family regulator
MKLTLAQLEAFFWVAQLGSVQLAARQLNLAQPTISLRLRDLEDVLGVVLLQRVGRGVRPTQEGLKLHKRAALVLDEISQIKEQTEATEVSGVLRIGFAEGFAMACLAPILGALRRDYPRLRPELNIATSSALERDLIAHRLDLAFLVNPIGHEGLQLQPLGTQPTTWAAPPAWKLGPVVRPSDLRQAPIISNPPPSAMYRQITDWFATAGIEPSRLDICTSVALVAHLVAAGAAIGLLPSKMIEAQVAAGQIAILSSTPPVADGWLYAVSWEGGQTDAIEAVLQTVRRVLSTIDYLKMANA